VVAIHAGDYTSSPGVNGAGFTVNAHGSIGAGVDSQNGKLIFRAYQTSLYALPDVPRFICTASGNPPVSCDNIVVATSATYVWFWNILASFVVSTRVPASEPSGFNISMYRSAPTGFKCLYSVIRDGPGGIFLDSRDAAGNVFDGGEVYGSIFYNQGWAGFDGGGHHIYNHCKAPTVRRNFQANIFGPDEANGVQHYAAGNDIYAWEQNFDHTDNIHFNSGTLNNVNGLGSITGNNNQLVLGGNTSSQAHMNGITALRNYFYWPDNYGDCQIQICQPGGADKIGSGVTVNNNYGRGGGAGFGVVRIAGILAAGGTLSMQSNTFRCQVATTPPAGPAVQWNGRLISIAENGGAGYTITSNQYYRNLGTGGGSCADENPGGKPFAFLDATGGCRTLSNFTNDCSFSGETLTLADPAVTVSFNVRADKYEPGRSHVVYYNWASLSRIPVDLSSTLSAGTPFRVDDWRDISGANTISVFDAAVAGNTVTTFTGALVYFPTTQLSDPVMVGSNWGTGVETAPPATAPFFNVFVVRRTG